MTRDKLTRKILSIKRAKSMTWKAIVAEIGGGTAVCLTAALMGQMKLRPEQAERAARLFELDEDEQRVLQEIPYRARCRQQCRPTPDLPLLRTRAGLQHDVEGTDSGGVRRRHHECHRFRHGDRAPRRSEGRSRQADPERQIPPI